jgi:hypothetical protein
MTPLIDFDGRMLYIVSIASQPLSISSLKKKKGIRDGFHGNASDKNRK